MAGSPLTKLPVIEGSALIKSLSVVRQDGVCLFQQNFGPSGGNQWNPQLMGGFFSAISNFAEAKTGQQLNSIQLNEDVILIETDRDLFFLLQYNPQSLDSEGAKLILYLAMQEFLARFPEASKTNKTDDFDSFYDVIPAMVSNVLEQTIQFDCPWCQTQHSVVIQRNMIDYSGKFPVKYTYVHGGSQNVLNLYIDQDFKVIQVEITGLIEMKADDVAQMLDSQADDLENLTPSVVFGVLLSREGQLRAQYLKEGWSPGCYLQSILDLWEAGRKCAPNKQKPDCLLFKMPDYWLIGAQEKDHELTVFTSLAVNGPQLFPKIHALLDQLLPVLSTNDLK